MHVYAQTNGMIIKHANSYVPKFICRHHLAKSIVDPKQIQILDEIIYAIDGYEHDIIQTEPKMLLH